MEKISEKLDIWKWAVFTLTFLYKFSLEKYVDKVFTCQKIDEFIPDISGPKNQFFGS